MIRSVLSLQHHIRCGEDLGEAIEDIQRCAELMGDLLDEVGLHLRRLLGTGIGNHQFLVLLSQTLRCPMAEVHEEQQHQQEQADDEDDEA